jgi:hypothetical protein
MPGMVSIQLQLKIIEILLVRDIAEFYWRATVLKIDTYLPYRWFCWWGIAWEILALEPKLAQNFIPSLQIGKRLTGWLLIVICRANQNSKSPLRTFICCHRTPESHVKFNRYVNTQLETFKWRVGLIIMGKVREKVSTFSL